MLANWWSPSGISRRTRTVEPSFTCSTIAGLYVSRETHYHSSGIRTVNRAPLPLGNEALRVGGHHVVYCPSLRAVRVPNALALSASFILQVSLVRIVFSRLPLHVLDLRPTVTEDLRRQVHVTNLRSTNVARYVFVGGKRVGHRERHGLADR